MTNIKICTLALHSRFGNAGWPLIESFSPALRDYIIGTLFIHRVKIAFRALNAP